MTYRVINWGTGNVGYHALRATIQHPHLELVGLHADLLLAGGVYAELYRRFSSSPART